MRKNITTSTFYTQALLECLCSSPLLVDHLPEAVCFDRGKFIQGGKVSASTDLDNLPELNFSQKLGHLYEDALGYLLKQSPELELLGQSIQVFDDNKITLGELDYILKDLTNDQFLHLELAVKFYLINYNGNEPTYPGPDPRDNWLNKLARMRDHQLQLANSKYGRRHLLENYGIEKIVTQHLVCGKLFDHYKADQKPNPPSMRADCQRGVWKYLHEWKDDSDASKVKVIPKCLWPVSSIENVLEKLDVLSREGFIVEVKQRCTMIWDEEIQATQFIAPDTWGAEE